MSSRSLNKVMLIGNLTRDVEVRYTPSGTAVATFGLATNRSWSAGDGGERQEETQFHRIVAWSKLAEICGQLLFKGRKIFIEGRLQTRKFTGQDGQQREITEIVAENMMILDTRTRDGGVPMGAPVQEEDFVGVAEEQPVLENTEVTEEKEAKEEKKPKKATNPPSRKASDGQGKAETAEEATAPASDEVNVEDIPF
ncbi:MAG: Single-stranded DNA-binding protein [Microgenomates group bacterium GW2011_GWC2_46_7]|nr:MAG: Single-stranded DNA-binding protein [Microgenomates group bacterium GW2011_GWC2_46_7]